MAVRYATRKCICCLKCSIKAESRNKFFKALLEKQRCGLKNITSKMHDITLLKNLEAET